MSEGGDGTRGGGAGVGGGLGGSKFHTSGGQTAAPTSPPNKISFTAKDKEISELRRATGKLRNPQVIKKLIKSPGKKIYFGDGRFQFIK